MQTPHQAHVHQSIGLYSTSVKVPFEEVTRIASAVQRQLTVDYMPIWQRPTLITAYEDGNAIPEGVWHAAIMDDIGEPGALGFHSNENNQPMALIDVNKQTSVTVSHEVLEMATDPFGNRLIPAILRGHRVLILCEVCDPDEAESYKVDGVLVSNFYRPEFFDDRVGTAPSYDFLGKLKAPMSLNPGGYISYMRGGRWYQDTWFGGTAPSTRGPLAMVRKPDQSLRSMIDEYMRANNWENTI